MKISAFPFLSVMFAVLLGMGVVRLITALGELIKHRERVHPHWLHLAWLLLLLLLYFHVWWSFWEFREATRWNYLTYLFLLMGPVSLFTAASLLIPNISDSSAVDSKSYYFSVHRGFFTAMSIAVLWGLSIYPVMFGQVDPILEWLLLFLAVMITLAVIRNEVVHKALTVVAWVLFIMFVGSYGFVNENI